MLYPLSYTGTIPVAGFEPATTRVSSEVTLVFTTGRIRFVNNETHPEVRRLGFRFAVAWIPSLRGHERPRSQLQVWSGDMRTRRLMHEGIRTPASGTDTCA